MGGMPGMPPMPMGGMPPPMPMPMGGPMGGPPPGPQGGRPASLGTLPAPSTAAQRAGFGAAVGAVASGPVAGAMPADVFAGGIPGGMMDASIPRPVAMMRGGGSVQYMQGGGAVKPNMREFMEATGVDAATASQALYGSVGSNVDIRDWDAIMSSGDPLRATQEATRQMYSTGAAIATDPKFYDPQTGAYTPTAVRYEGASPVSGTNLQVLNGQIYITDAAGLPLTQLSPQNAASFGVSQADIDAAVAAAGITDERAGRFQGVGYQPYDAGSLLRSGYESLLTGSRDSAMTKDTMSPYEFSRSKLTSMLGGAGGAGYATGPGAAASGSDLAVNSGADLTDLNAALGSSLYSSAPVGGGGFGSEFAEYFPVTSLPQGASYQPTMGTIPTFTRGASDAFGTRPVTYYSSPQARITGGIGSIDLPARPESVNILDWLGTPPVRLYGGAS